MATAIGMGFDVSALLDSIKNADKALGDLMSKSNQASKSIINAFQQMSSQGVGAYVESLEKQIRLYESINATITETSGKAKKGYEEMKSGVDTVVNSLNDMIKILQQTNLYKEYKIKLVSDEELAKLKAYQTEISNLFNSEMQYSQRMQAIKDANANKTQRELEEYKKLSSEIERLQKLQSSATYELNKPTSMATYNAAKNVLPEIERQLADHKARMVELERKYEAEILVINQQGSIARFEEIRKAERKDLDANEKYKKDKEKNINSLASSYERESEALKRKVEAEENAQKRIQALAQQAIEAQKLFVEKRVNDANKVAQAEHEANQKTFQEALKIQQQALERFARNENDKREEIRRTREAGLEAAQALDKAQAKTESLNRAKNYQRTQKYGDTSSQALAAYDRLVSGKGQLSVNNMQDVLSKLEQAQNKINLKTSEGRERYNELEAAIKKVKATIDSVVNAEENAAKKRAKNADEAKKHEDEARKSLEKRLKLLKDIAAEQSKNRSSLYRLTQSSGDTTKQAQAAYNRIYGDKGIQSIKNFSDVLSKLESAQVKINQRTEDGRRKYEEFDKMIQRVKTSIQDLSTTDSAKSEALRNAQAKTNKQTKANSARIKSERDAMYKMYEQMFDGIAKKNGQTAEQIIKKNQEELRQRKKYIDEMTNMYARMFDEIAKKESQNRASKYGRIQSTGDTTSQALAAYNRLYSDKGVKSINNMNAALQKLRDAQSKLNLDTEEGRKKYSQLGDAIKRVEKDMAKLSQQSENVNKKHSQLLNISEQLQRRLALVFSVSQIAGYINKIVKVRGEFELQQKALQAIVQNVDEANKLWDKTVALAVKSPFRVKELVTYTKQLAAYRIETSQLYDTTKRLADVSAGLGVDMQRLILAYGQVRAANFLRGTELRQFTEAGIPMLEELAKHFTELEGRAISVGDVFERISKRMVTFEDVSAVFQKMTDEGGVFYDMQAKQSETLKGQISNLHDAVDLMMNDIGKSNDSILKSLVSTMRTLVDNWKAFATAIEEAGAAFAVIHLARFATGLRIAAAGHAALAISMKGSISMGAKFQKMLTTLFATIKAHPFIALSGAILAALYSWHRYNQSIDEANEKYNELSRSEIRRAKTLNDLNDKILENNKAIKDNNKTVEEQNDAIKSNNKILSQIKRDYPELYNAVVKQTDGTIDLTEAIKTQNEELRANIALQQQAKGSFWQESQGKNYNDAVEAQKKYAASLEDLNGKAIDLGYQLEYAFDQGKISDESYKRLKEYLKLISNTNDITKLAKREELLITTPYGSHKSYTTSQNTLFENLIGNEEDRELVTKFYYSIEQAVDNAASANAKYTSSLKNLWDTFINQMPTYSTELNKITNAEDRGKWLKEQLTNLNFIDEKLQEWARERLVKELKLEIIFSKEDGRNNDKLDDWAIRVKSAIEEVNEKIKNENKDIPENWLFPIPEVGQTKEQYLNSVKPALEAAKAIYREGQKIEDESAIERTNALKPYADIIERILNIQEKGANKDNEALQRLKEQIRLVRELAKDYQKLWDEQGKDVADASIWSKERIEAFRKAGLDYTKFEVGSEGDEVKNLEKLTDISGELYKAIADARTELGSFKQQLKDAEFARYLDELFGNYEISLELEKLNIPSDLAKKLFGVESIDLNSIRKEILNKAGLGDMQGMTNEAIFSSERYLKLNKEQRKIIEDGLNKENELQDKALKERLKRYSQFLVKGQSEAVKVKIQELRDLKKLEEDYRSGQMNISEPEYQRMVEGIKKESNDKIAKLSFDDFQDSTMYKNLFSDIQSVGTKSIDLVLNHLYKLRDAMKDVPPEVFAKLQERIDELEKLKIERNPFKGLEDAANTIKKVKKERETYTDKDGKEIELKGEDALNYRLIKNEEEIQQENKKLEILYQIKEANGSIDALKKVGLETNEQALILLGREDEINNEILDTQKNIGKLQGENKGIDKQLRDYSKAKAKIVAVAEAWVSVIENTKKAVDSTKQIFIALGADADSAAMDIAEIGTSFLDATAQLILFATQMQLMQAQATALGVTLNAALGPIGWIAAGLSALSSIVVPIFGAHDKKKEREIQKQIELVGKLEKQYEKLEKQIEKAYTTVDLKSSFDQAQDNLDQQIEARKEMIAQEESKKKTDKNRIKEWQNEIEELQEQQQELLQSTVEDLGGTYDYKSATREFVDAWIDAFRETGNGLKGLEDNFDDFWKNIMLNQAVMGGASQIIEPLIKEINKALENDFKVDDGEWSKIENEKDTAFQRLNDFMQGWFNQWGDTFSDDSGELSGLQRGIQGISESTAQILESYLNSVRMFVADNNSILSGLANNINTGVSFNPIVDQLKSILDQTTAINKLLDSVASNGGATAFNVRLLSE